MAVLTRWGNPFTVYTYSKSFCTLSYNFVKYTSVKLGIRKIKEEKKEDGRKGGRQKGREGGKERGPNLYPRTFF